VVVVVTGGGVVVTGGGEDDGAEVDDATDGRSWLTEVVGAASWAAAPVGSTGWSEVRTTQKVATRPTVRVAATAMGSFRLAVCSVLCRPGIQEHLALGTGHAHTARHITK
jgi:hypothetical protein